MNHDELRRLALGFSSSLFAFRLLLSTSVGITRVPVFDGLSRYLLR